MPLLPTNKPQFKFRAQDFLAPAVFVLLVMAGFLCALAAKAKEVATAQASGSPCAVVTRFGGEVQVLNSDRSHLVEFQKNSGVPCGGWVYVIRGYAEVHHRDGFTAHLGADTFVQFPESNLGEQISGDHFVLFKGEMFVSSDEGAGEARVQTANARARIARGSAIVEYNSETEDSQLIAIDQTATLENRFEISKRISVQPGEASTLNFKLLRVVPSAPSAVALSSLKPRLQDLHLGEKAQMVAMVAAQARANRKLASDLNGSKHVSVAQKKEMQDTYALTKARAKYLPHPVDEEASRLKAHFVNRMVAGELAGEKMLYPDKFYGKAQSVSVQVIDPADKFLKKKQKNDDAEKKKLIEELAKIRDE